MAPESLKNFLFLGTERMNSDRPGHIIYYTPYDITLVKSKLKSESSLWVWTLFEITLKEGKKCEKIKCRINYYESKKCNSNSKTHESSELYT